MPAVTIYRTLDISTLNSDEMHLLMDIAADPEGDHMIGDDCRLNAVRRILAFHGIEIGAAGSAMLDSLRGDCEPGPASGPDYEGRILAAQERACAEGDVS